MGCLFGWYNQKGKRRFRRSYESMARQNSKTFKNGIRGTYIAGFSGYHYGKLFTALLLFLFQMAGKQTLEVWI